MAADPTIIYLTVVASLYFVFVGVILKTRGLREPAAGLLLLYVVISALWPLGQASSCLAWPPLSPDQILTRVELYGLPLLSLLFLHLTRSFLRAGGTGRIWWAVGVGWMATLVALNENLLALPERMWIGPGWIFGRQVLPFGVWVIGWGVFLGAATLLTATTYRHTQQPLHRNRIKYWSLALALTVASTALLLTGRELLGHALHLLSTLSTMYAVFTYHLPDVRQMARRMLSYLIVTLLTVAVYTVGFLAMQAVFQPTLRASPVLVGVAVALVLGVLLNPLLTLVRQWVKRLVSGTRYDPSRTLREYSTSISNILDLERLATVVVGLVGDTLGVQRGALFVVHREDEEEGTGGQQERGGHFRLRGVTGTEEDLPPALLPAESPVARCLRREHRPLTQYDIDLLPRFEGISHIERAWLHSLDMDVYVPIYAKGEWIGLLALGRKVSGDRYYDDDLNLLSTLADQTAVALENARLFDDLKMRNADNERLNQELTQANRELARLDQAKSDFIDIASHELRTPLTQVHGYNDILGEMLEDGSLTPEVGSQLTQVVRQGIQRLEEIVDVMFDVSQLDTETLILSASSTSVASIVRMAADMWAEALQERHQTLIIEGLEELPAIVADGKRLKQVFSHLIQNAIKFTPDGGQIRIAARPPDEGAPPHEQTVEIIVGDTGIGIAPDDLERIFEKFYRVGDVMSHSTGKTKFKGAGPGLGLTIARGIVKAHGGRIWAESLGYDEQLCPGSQFHVLLPVRSRHLESTGLEAFIAAVKAGTYSFSRPHGRSETHVPLAERALVE